jgi:hypothetical protein
MKIFVNEKATKEMLSRDDWFVSDEVEAIAMAIRVGCRTIYIGDATNSIAPSLCAPTIDDAMRFIEANEEVH